MFVFLNRYNSIVIFVCLCAVSLVLSCLTVKATHQTAHTTDVPSSSLKRNTSTFLAPIYFCSSAISSISVRIRYLASVFASVWQKPMEKTELQKLQSKVDSLEYQLDAERDRNKRLEKLYELSTNLGVGTDQEAGPNLRLLPAKVTGVEPNDWFRYITIDKGAKNGVAVDMAVITQTDLKVTDRHLAGAVVGKVVDVQRSFARVQLITDRLSVAAVTIGSLGDLVLLRGKPETENCAIDEIPSTTHELLKEKQAVMIDERSSIFPAGMLVGRISSIKKEIHFCRIEVQPAFKFGNLREVMVVIDD